MSINQRLFKLFLSINFLAFSFIGAQEEISGSESVRTPQTTTEQNDSIEKGLFRGKRGKHGKKGDRGKSGPRGHRGVPGEDGATGPTGPTGADGINGAIGPTGPTGPTGATGATGASVSTVYSSHYGIASFYEAQSEGTIPIVFNVGGFSPNIDIGTTFAEESGLITVSEAGIYELHADVSFASTDTDLFGNAYAELSFMVNGSLSGLGSTRLSKTLFYSDTTPVSAQVSGSLTTTVYLAAGDTIGTTVVGRPGSTGLDLTDGQINFIVRKVAENIP